MNDAYSGNAPAFDPGFVQSTADYYNRNSGLLSMGSNGQLMGRDASGQQTALDPQLQQMIDSGYLTPTTDANGNVTVAASNLYNQNVQKAIAAHPNDPNFAVGTPSSDWYQGDPNAAKGTGPGWMTPQGPAFDFMKDLPEGVNVTSWKGSSTPTGSFDPTTGLQGYESTMRPGSFQMPDKFGELMYHILPAAFIGLTTSGIGDAGLLPDLGDLGDFANFGKLAFNTAGNAVLGNKPNPLSFLGPIGSYLGLPGFSGSSFMGLNPATLAQLLMRIHGGSNG
jgi:hypothetical protein